MTPCSMNKKKTGEKTKLKKKNIYIYVCIKHVSIKYMQNKKWNKLKKYIIIFA